MKNTKDNSEESVFIKVRALVNEEVYEELKKDLATYEEWESVYESILKEIEDEERYYEDFEIDKVVYNLFVSDRSGNIDCINDLYGFAEYYAEEDLTNEEIAEYLKSQIEDEYFGARNEKYDVNMGELEVNIFYDKINPLTSEEISYFTNHIRNFAFGDIYNHYKIYYVEEFHFNSNVEELIIEHNNKIIYNLSLKIDESFERLPEFINRKIRSLIEASKKNNKKEF